MRATCSNDSPARAARHFFPFAGTNFTWDDYRDMVQPAFDGFGIRIVGAHQCADLPEAIAQAESPLVGGGNTFRLLRELRQRGCLPPLRDAVAAGIP